MTPTIPDYCSIPVGLKRGDKARGVLYLQEWLTLNGDPLVIDGEFGPATERAVWKLNQLDRTVTDDVVLTLTRPMRTALTATGDMVEVGESYLYVHAREVGGQNRGPWVRLFTGGLDGPSWAWCGAYVRTLAEQAGHPWAERISFSCDVTAKNAKADGRMRPAGEKPERGDLFLVRKSATDWTHIGLVTRVGDDWIETGEGNSNDEGSREGHEVCSLTRGLSRLDFVRMA